MDVFKSLDMQQKISFLDEATSTTFLQMTPQEVYTFIRGIVCDRDENYFIRLKACDLLVDLAVTNQISPRQLLLVLIDEWHNSDVFLEIKRLKSLLLFWDFSPDEIADVFEANRLRCLPEVDSECNYCLGLTRIIQANSSNGLSSKTPTFLLN